MTIEIDLKHSYDKSGRTGLNFHFHLNLPGQGITSVTGPSGIGKTTLLRCLAGLEKASGRLSVNGRLWQDENFFLPPHKRPIGYVFQEACLFPHLTVARNLAFGAKRSQRRQGQNHLNLDRLIDISGIGHLMDRQPDTLSGGEKQRVALARAMASNPDLLLLDEPLAGLDQNRKEEILPYLENLKELALPIVYVSHAQEEINRLADVQVKLDQAVGREGLVEICQPCSGFQGGPRPHREEAIAA